MSEATPAPAASFERDDIELIRLFLGKYKDSDGNSYNIESRPEATERKAKAIEAIAGAKNGKKLGVEHTKIQPFEGQKADDVPFLAGFEHLRTDLSLRLPNQFIDVLVPAKAIQKGVVWAELAPKVREWFIGARNTFPPDGESWHAIPDLGFELKVLVQTMEIPSTEGSVVVGRLLPSGEPFAKVLRRALENKVPKLAATPADKRILLLEDEGVAIGFVKVTHGIDASVGDLPDLKKIDAVWCAHTMSWKSEGDVMFCHIWPGGVKERFWIKDDRFSAKKAAPKS